MLCVRLTAQQVQRRIGRLVEHGHLPALGFPSLGLSCTMEGFFPLHSCGTRFGHLGSPVVQRSHAGLVNAPRGRSEVSRVHTSADV